MGDDYSNRVRSKKSKKKSKAKGKRKTTIDDVANEYIRLAKKKLGSKYKSLRQTARDVNAGIAADKRKKKPRRPARRP